MSRLERLRNSAAALLRQLRQARAESLARQAETDQTDPMTQIRGRSAMDDAVAEAEGMLARLETLLGPDASASERSTTRGGGVGGSPGARTDASNPGGRATINVGAAARIMRGNREPSR